MADPDVSLRDDSADSTAVTEDVGHTALPIVADTAASTSPTCTPAWSAGESVTTRVTINPRKSESRQDGSCGGITAVLLSLIVVEATVTIHVVSKSSRRSETIRPGVTSATVIPKSGASATGSSCWLTATATFWLLRTKANATRYVPCAADAVV